MDIQHLRSSFNVHYWSNHTEDQFLQEAGDAGLYDWLPAAEREQALREAYGKIQSAEGREQEAEDLAEGREQEAEDLAEGSMRLAEDDGEEE